MVVHTVLNFVVVTCNYMKDVRKGSFPAKKILKTIKSI